MIPIEIQGANQFGNQTKANLHKHNGNTGVVVYSEPLHEWSPVFLPAFNPTFGAEMAQNFSFGGTPEGVHNGLDSVLWTATNEAGNKFSFNSTDQAHSGAQSIKANKPAVNNVMQIDNGSNIDLSNFKALTMFIYVSNSWGTGDSFSIYGWDTASGQTIGNEVFLEDFFNETDFGQWHKVVIGLDDLGLSSATIDSFRIECVSTSGQSPTFYIDDFQIEETGNTSIFTLTTGNDTLMEVHQISFSIVAPLDIRLADATTTNLSYDKFLNLNALDNGLLFQSMQKG